MEKEKSKHSFDTKRKIIRLVISFIVVLAIFGILYFILDLSGALKKIDSVDELSSFIKNTGVYSRLIFMLLQFLQVTFLPLPGFITTVAGALVFGPLETTIMSIISIFLGSINAFYLGKKFGGKLLSWAIGEEDAKKWQDVLAEGKYAFFLMMLFPIFPDDILCMVAGITNMSYKFFIITNLITRPISIICTCFVGSGYLIPFKGWGIYVWIVILLFVVGAFYIATKYQKQIEEIIANFARKKEKEEQIKIQNKNLKVKQNTNKIK